MQYPYISVIIPVYNEENYINSCLSSVYKQDYPKEQMEVIVVDGNSSDQTVEIIKQNFKEVKIINNPDRIVPISMNLGIKAANGDYIIRLDAHSNYPNNYFSRLIERIGKGDVCNVGGVCDTLPVNDKAKSKAIAIALSTKFGMGNSAFRVGANEERYVDTVPFGCYPKSLFEDIGYYDEELVRNQDDELNARLIKKGYKIVLLPDLVIDYFARDKISKVWKMFYQYGLYKPLVNKKLKGAATIRQFVPLLFVVGLILGLILSIFIKNFYIIYLIGILLYLALDFIASIKNSSSFKIFLYLFIIYPIIHFAYGWGYIVGIFKILFNKPFTAKVNR